MTTLTYPYLGDSVKVGDALGCDPTGWPYRIEAVEHVALWGTTTPTRGHGITRVTVEPWPLPSPHATDEEKAALKAAQEHARERFAVAARRKKD